MKAQATARCRALAAIGEVHLAALTGFKYRLSVLFNWTVGLLGGGRAKRVITLQQVFGRHAMAAAVCSAKHATWFTKR